MRAWMKAEAVGDFPTVDGIVMRVMGRMEVALREYPRYGYSKDHEHCALHVASGLRLACSSDDTERVTDALLAIADLPTQHVLQLATGRDAAANWAYWAETQMWRTFQFAFLGLHCASGAGAIVPGPALPGGKEQIYVGPLGVSNSVLCMAALVDALVWVAVNRGATLDSGRPPPHNLASLPGYTGPAEMRPAWLVEALDAELPPGAKRPSEILLGVSDNAAAACGS